jgi:hypothetical protein
MAARSVLGGRGLRRSMTRRCRRSSRPPTHHFERKPRHRKARTRVSAREGWSGANGLHPVKGWEAIDPPPVRRPRGPNAPVDEEALDLRREIGHPVEGMGSPAMVPWASLGSIRTTPASHACFGRIIPFPLTILSVQDGPESRSCASRAFASRASGASAIFSSLRGCRVGIVPLRSDEAQRRDSTIPDAAGSNDGRSRVLRIGSSTCSRTFPT